MELQESNVSEINLESEPNSLEKRSCIRWRYVMAILTFLGMFNSFCIRGSLSVAIVSMTQPTSLEGVRIATYANGTNGSIDYNENDLSYQAPLFDWDSQIQGIILGGFFWGYIIPMAISGVMVNKYGVKYVMLIGGLLAVVGALLGPIAAVTNAYLLVATRVICGFGLAVVTPCGHTIVASWFHPNERSRFMSFIYSGNQFGVAGSFVLTGYICKLYPTEGWKWSFYISGVSCAAWLVAWFFLAYSTPKENPWISDQERLYIEKGLSSTRSKTKGAAIPWKSIATSRPIWAIMTNGFGQGWGFYTILTQLPLYMKTILGFDMSQSGIYASLPYLMTIIVSYTGGITADLLIRRKILSTVTVRRIFSLIGMLTCGFCLLAITFANSDTIIVYTLLVLGVAMSGCMHSGSFANHIDLAPNYAGLLQGVINTSTTIPGILTPYVAGVILGNEGGEARWNVVFYISSGMLIGCVIIYTIFTEAQIQPWNNIADHSGDVENTANSNVDLSKIENGVVTLTEQTDCNIKMKNIL